MPRTLCSRYINAVYAGLLLVSALPAAQSQSADGPGMEEIVVTGRFIDPNPVTASQTRLPAERIDRARPTSLADALRLAPAAHVQTNSRGQTLVFLRNSGERQTAVFYDGAPLVVPWDYRLDLSLIPAAALADIAVTTGPSSVRFGPNTVGGIIELLPSAPVGPEAQLAGRAEAGQAGLAATRATGLTRLGPWSLTAGAGVRDRGDQPLPSGAGLRFSQPNTDRRLNTDRRRINGFARLARKVPGGDVAASALVVDSRFGIAPEGQVDPATGNVRFWRYPDHRLAMGIVSADLDPGSGFQIKATGWVQSFAQTIESYDSAAFETVADVQKDDDLTLGLRTALDWHGGPHTLRGSAQFFVATHKQRDIAFVDGAPPAQTPPRNTFRQRTLSLGGEYQWAAMPTLDLFLGAGGDWLDPTRTGERPDSGTFLDYNLIGGVRWRPHSDWSFRGSAGRKVRLPTMRELFGAAIDRFIINPDLRPERAVLAEIGATWRGIDGLHLSVVPFASLVSGTLDQRNVTVDGDTFRQRVNLPGSRVYGVEASATAHLGAHLTLAGHVTATRVRRQPDQPDGPVRIAEKPNIRARLDLAYQDPDGLGATLSLDHTGRAFSFTDNSRFVPLAVSTVLDLELSYNLARLWSPEGQIRAFLRVDNVTDTVIEPQLGLPGPGRWLRGGVSLRY